MNKYRLTCLILFLLLVLVALVAGIIIFATGSKDEIGETLNKFNVNECTQEETTFTHSPVELEKLTNIVPLGNLNPSAHTFPTVHMYYFLNDRSNVYAPIDAKIETLTVMIHKDENPPFTDYSINFRTCEDFTYYFIHVKSLSEKLQKIVDDNSGKDCNEYTTGGRTFRNCWIGDLSVDVKAGELLGTAGPDTEQSAALDFGVTDYGIEPHTFANPDRWIESGRDDVFYKVCSTDYYSDALEKTIQSKLGGFNQLNQTTPSPTCGTNAQDIPGTAQGVWFLQESDSGTSEDLHMALVHDNFDQVTGAFSNGASLEGIGIGIGIYYFDPETSGNVNLDFDLVTPSSQVYCYEITESFTGQDNSFSILLQMPDEETIRIGKLASPTCGNGPWSTGEVITFNR